MLKYFVDSNVFLRFYSKDDEKQRQQVKVMLLRVQKKKIELFCGPVFFEVAWVLGTNY